MNKNKKPLFRKANKTCHNHGFIKKSFNEEKNLKKFKHSDSNKIGMHSNKKNGFDYTPLFKFLISKVGNKWDEVYSEAKSRLDKTEPIFWMVKNKFPEGNESLKYFGLVRIGESTFYSELYIDENNILQKVNPNASLKPECKCCTFTLNGNEIKK